MASPVVVRLEDFFTPEALAELERLSERYGVQAVYLFGSRADDGLARLRGETVSGEGSDLDVGVARLAPRLHPFERGGLHVELDDLFEPLDVDLVMLDEVDPLFRFEAIDGHRIWAADGERVDSWELVVMRRAPELLPIQRRLEEEFLGIPETSNE